MSVYVEATKISKSFLREKNFIGHFFNTFVAITTTTTTTQPPLCDRNHYHHHHDDQNIPGSGNLD